jgi:hypothetical protein
MMHNVLSSNEISDILNDPIVKMHKANLSDAQKVVKFSFPLSDDMRNKLSNRLSMLLPPRVPMRWVQGDTPLHTDKGEKQFSKTHLIYLTNSVGRLIIDGQSHPIAAGDAHVFSEGLEHCTVNTGTSERLMIGPMSETGFGVGAPSNILYFSNKTDAETSMNSIGSSYNFTLTTINGISSWNIYSNSGGVNPSPNGGPYSTGTALVAIGVYYVYPYTPPPPPPRLPVWGSLFTNNAWVYYQSHSLSTGSGGSGVRNYRHKQRKT